MASRRILIIAVACILLLALGLALDWKGFTGNLIAGAIEVIVTVTIIDWLLQRQRRRQWQKVRTQIVGALTQHIDNIVDEYQTTFYGPELDLIGLNATAGPYGVPNPNTAKALETAIARLEEAPRPEDSKERAERLYTTIKWDINQILMTLLPGQVQNFL